jgi:glycosyltransferase involved in cell wall biosynthesis
VDPTDSVPFVRLVRISCPEGKRLKPLIYFLKSAVHAVTRENYDIVHLHNVEAAFVLPFLKLKYPVLTTAHGSPVRVKRQKWGRISQKLMGLMEYPYLFLSDCATSVSKTDADYFARRYNKRVRYVPNGTDSLPCLEGSALSQTLNELGVQEGQYLLFAAGRIDPTKGCHLAIEAFKDVDSGLKLLVLGDLAQMPEYSQRLRQMADSRVVFTHHIRDKARLFGIVKSCRLFVFPSLLEAMSMMLMEASSLGVPIVCSDIPENTAVLADTGFYFRSGDALDLKAKLRWALSNYGEINDYAKKAKSRVTTNFSWDTIADQYEQCYAQLLSRK